MISLPPMPARIAALPRDHRGYPVPWFVAWVDGKPIFPMADARKQAIAIRDKKCWVCGEPLGRFLSFPIGPMCSINRVSAEPPCHHECAVFSAKACPFLTKPKMRRADIPEKIGAAAAPGIMLERNPGVACVWTTKSFRIFRVPNGVLFRIGDPTGTEWFAEGRTATRDEVEASIASGLPSLEEMAVLDGPAATAELGRMTAAARQYLPSCA